MILKIKGPSYLHLLIYFALLILSSLLFFVICKLIIWLSIKVKNAIMKRNDNERKHQRIIEQQKCEENEETSNSPPVNENNNKFKEEQQSQRNQMLEALAHVVNGDIVQMTDTSILTMNEV